MKWLENLVSEYYDEAVNVFRTYLNLDRPAKQVSLGVLNLRKDIIWFILIWRFYFIPVFVFEPRFRKDLARGKVIQDAVYREYVERTTLLPNPLPPWYIRLTCWLLQYRKMAIAAFITTLILIAGGLSYHYLKPDPETQVRTKTLLPSDPYQVPNLSNLIPAVLEIVPFQKSSSEPIPGSCYVSSNHSFPSGLRFNLHCNEKEGFRKLYFLHMNASEMDADSVDQVLYKYPNQTIGLHLYVDSYLDHKILDNFRRLFSGKDWPKVRILIFSAKDPSYMRQILEVVAKSLQISGQGAGAFLGETSKVGTTEIILMPGREDVEQLASQYAALMQLQSENQCFRLVIDWGMTPEVASQLAASLTANNVKLCSAHYKITARSYKEALQVPVLPAEVVHVLLQVPDVAETARVKATVVFGEFPDNLKDLRFEILHRNVRTIGNLADLKTLCREGRFEKMRSRNYTAYLINCELDT